MIFARWRALCRHVLPLLKGLVCGSRGLGNAAAIGVFVQKACLRRPGVASALTARFRLTPTEVRVLFGVVEVGGVREIARVLGMAEGTAKTHLKRLFTKTGTARQAALGQNCGRTRQSSDRVARSGDIRLLWNRVACSYDGQAGRLRMGDLRERIN